MPVTKIGLSDATSVYYGIKPAMRQQPDFFEVPADADPEFFEHCPR